MLPEPKVFTRDEPCTKEDIWLCFRSMAGFRRVPVHTAHTVIGVNVPRGMQRQGRLLVVTDKDIDYYVLTDEGQEWLLNGYRNYLRNHPDRKPHAKFVPRGWFRAK